MGQTRQFELLLQKIFADQAPHLPSSIKRLLVRYAPWFVLLAGLLSVWGAWGLWHWAHVANTSIRYANQINETVGAASIPGGRLGLAIWLSLLALVVQATLLLLAVSGLQKRTEAGWRLAYYAVLVSVFYGVVVMVSSYGGFGDLLRSLAGAVIGFYVLFQIRSSYKGRV